MVSRGADRPREPLVRSELFEMGEIRFSDSIRRLIPPSEVMRALRQHAQMQWGEVGEADWKANDIAVTDGGCAISQWTSSAGITFLINTAPYLRQTIVLIPSDALDEFRATPDPLS